MNNKSVTALTTEAEQKEIAVVLSRPVGKLVLQYLAGSKRKGLALWNVLSPQLPKYPPNGGNNGYPTFSLGGLKQNGLI